MASFFRGMEQNTNHHLVTPLCELLEVCTRHPRGHVLYSGISPDRPRLREPLVVMIEVGQNEIHGMNGKLLVFQPRSAARPVRRRE